MDPQDFVLVYHIFYGRIVSSFHFLVILQNHNLPISYNFHKYMVRSMEDEFYGIVGIGYVCMYIFACSRDVLVLLMFKSLIFYLSDILQLATLGLCYNLHLHKHPW